MIHNAQQQSCAVPLVSAFASSVVNYLATPHLLAVCENLTYVRAVFHVPLSRDWLCLLRTAVVCNVAHIQLAEKYSIAESCRESKIFTRTTVEKPRDGGGDGEEKREVLPFYPPCLVLNRIMISKPDMLFASGPKMARQACSLNHRRLCRCSTTTAGIWREPGSLCLFLVATRNDLFG